MFSSAFEKVSKFTRPVIAIGRQYGGNKVVPNCGTMVFVNENATAVTCKHVVETPVISAKQVNKNYQNFKIESMKLNSKISSDREVRELSRKHQFTDETIIQCKYDFPFSVDRWDDPPEIYLHPHAAIDLAIIKFNGYTRRLYDSCAVFPKNTSVIMQGRSLCQIGFPFVEFSNFRYNQDADDIEWLPGTPTYPMFALDGMITRLLTYDNGSVEIELTSRCLKGGSGGPLFDSKGLVYGIQSYTDHLAIGADRLHSNVANAKNTGPVLDPQFLRVGRCLHANTIKAFLNEKQVPFCEE